MAAAGHAPHVLAVNRSRDRRNVLSTTLQVAEEIRIHARVIPYERVAAHVDLRLAVLCVDEEVQFRLYGGKKLRHTINKLS